MKALPVILIFLAIGCFAIEANNVTSKIFIGLPQAAPLVAHAVIDPATQTTPVGLDSAQSNTDDHSVQDVQLAIRTTNSVVHANMQLGLALTVTNASDLTIVVAEGFYVNLVSDSGERHKLFSPSFLYRSRKLVSVRSGEFHEWNILVEIPKDIAPGNYTFEAGRSFSANNKVTEMKSNLLKMVIK